MIYAPLLIVASLAQDMPENSLAYERTSTVVTFNEPVLTTLEGRRKIEKRIYMAAVEVCAADRKDAREQAARAACIETARRRAIEQVSRAFSATSQGAQQVRGQDGGQH